MSVRCGGMRPIGGVLLPEGVGRHAEEDRRAALDQVERQLGELRRLDERDAVLGEQVVQHAGVLHADEGAEDAHHPGRQAEVERRRCRRGAPGCRRRCR